MEQIKNPLDHNVRSCFPQKKAPNLSIVAEDDFDFNFPIISDKQIVGGASKIKWIWSSSPLISFISQLTSSAVARILSNKKSRFSEVST